VTSEQIMVRVCARVRVVCMRMRAWVHDVIHVGTACLPALSRPSSGDKIME